MATYYVKNSGLDSNTGLSDAQAFQTIAKINSMSLSPGDFVLFNKGDVWRETLEVPSSGSSGSNIKFSYYGSGINPRILGSKATTTWTNQGGNVWKTDVTFTNPRNIYPNFNDITFQYSTGNFIFGVFKALGSLTTEYDYTWSANFIYVFAATDPSTRYIGVEVPQRSFCISTNDFDYLHFDGIDILYAANTGIDSNNDHTVSFATGLIIENCEIGFIGGTSGQQYGFGIATAYDTLTIRNCEIHHCGRRGISINMEFAASPYTITNILIENNTFYGGSHTTSLDMTVNNGGNSSSINGVIFRYNLVYEDPTSAVSYTVNSMWFQRYNGSASTTNVYIYSNIFKYWRDCAIASEGINGFIYTYNNTFFENNTTTTPSYGYYADTDRGAANHVIKNNIFYTTRPTDVSASGALIVTILPNSYLTCDYNLFYRINNSVRTHLINGADYYMNTIVNLPNNWENNSPTPGNPLFISTSDLHLQATSPAIASGTNLALPLDFDGNPWDPTNPSIGAYQYGSVEPPDPPDPPPDPPADITITRARIHKWRITFSASDWFLPSKDESVQMIAELRIGHEGTYGFSDGGYWSSSEFSATDAWYKQNVNPVASIDKNYALYVRACRAFTSTTNYNLRDIGPSGGWIFYKNGDDYLEAAPSDQSLLSQAWSNINNVAIGTTGTAIGTGQANTTAIINQVGHTASAAKLCDDLIT